MDYEKLHKETITKLQEMVNSGKITVETACGICADFVPESEDDGIIKDMIETIKKEAKDFPSSVIAEKSKSWIAWLEKQGKNNMGISEATKQELEDNLNKALETETPESCYEFLDEQGEQKLPIEKLSSEMKTVGESLGFTNQEECNRYNQMVTDLIMSDDDNGEQKPYGQRQECVDCQFNYAGECKGSCAMKRGEQKPADKVKPKFKVGDWVIDKQDIVHQIANVIENVTYHTYCYDIVGGGYFNDNTEGVRLWTIQDAKDGDVLATKAAVFIFKHIDKTGLSLCKSYCEVIDNSELGLGFDFSMNSVNPATKEQRDLLFQKMCEAGYEWDAEKKELKKLEQKPIACSDGTIDNSLEGIIYAAIYWGKEAPTENGIIPEDKVKGAVDYYCSLLKNNDGWSEEDEKMMKAIIEDIHCGTEFSAEEMREANKREDWFKSLKERIQPQPKQEWSEKDKCMLNNVIDTLKPLSQVTHSGYAINSMINWLKSLRPHSAWKPSDEQMDMLKIAVSTSNSIVLDSLYNDLKKLREE